MLPKSKNKINKPKNTRILARSSIITVKNCTAISPSIPTRSQKTSFGHSNLFVDDSDVYSNYFYSKLLF